MNWNKLGAVLTSTAYYIAAIIYVVWGLIDWKPWIEPINERERRKKEKGKIRFFGALLALTGFVAATVWVYCTQTTNELGQQAVPRTADVSETQPETEEQESASVMSTGEITDVSEVQSETGEQESVLVNETKESASDAQELINKRYDGGFFVGQINDKTDLPEGTGQMVYDNGDIYDGGWKNGIFSGHGIMKYRNGDIYDGEWENGERNGEGEYTWKNGGVYIGKYKNGLREGYGEFIGWTGYRETYGWTGTYRGNSKDDMFEGQGIFEFNNGDIFDGDFSRNRIWTGTYIRSDGSCYNISQGVKVQSAD